MKLNDILNESTSEVYLINLNDGGGFNVTADSSQEARSKAKKKLRAGQTISSILKDRQGSNELDDKKEKLKKYVDNSRKLQQNPSDQRKFKRRIKNATTSSKLQSISDDISSYGDEPAEKKETEDKE